MSHTQDMDVDGTSNEYTKEVGCGSTEAGPPGDLVSRTSMGDLSELYIDVLLVLLFVWEWRRTFDVRQMFTRDMYRSVLGDSIDVKLRGRQHSVHLSSLSSNRRA
jgi:hypothetical protein